MDVEKHWLTTVGLITSSLIAITANFLLLLVFCRRRGLRTVSNRFVINLLFINLLSSLLLVPFLIAEQEALQNGVNFNVSEIVATIGPNMEETILYEKQVINGTLFERKQLLFDNSSDLEIIESDLTVQEDVSVFFCGVSQFCLNFVCTASILSILLIGIDQYFAVLHPLRCHSYMDKTKSLMMIVTSWLLSLIFASVTVIINANADFFPKICPPSKIQTSHLIFALVYFAVIILTPITIIFIIYLLIYRAAHKNSSRIRKRTNTNLFNTRSAIFTALPGEEIAESSEASVLNRVETSLLSEPSFGLPKVHSAPNFCELSKHNELCEFVNPPKRVLSVKRTHSERTHRNIITSLRTKFSNATVFRYREESRTAKISIIVIFMVLICYVPYGTIFIIDSLYARSELLQHLNYAALILLISSNLISPVLFAYRNRRVQRELKKFFGQYLVRREEFVTTRPRIVINHIETDLNKSTECVNVTTEPFLATDVADCKVETEKKSILKRVCSKNWSNYKKCSFINVPDGCLDARGSFSSASTQISTEE